jgi:2-polyprenyl-3-methyl-5-hydroxy-6-metoxy-1,4-benzoquinol methylase
MVIKFISHHTHFIVYGIICISGSCEDCNVPTLVEALRGKVIVDVACGGGDAQTLALQDNGNYIWI